MRKNQQPSHHLGFSVILICKVRKGNDLADRLQQRSFAAAFATHGVLI